MGLKILGTMILKGLLKASTFYSSSIRQGSLWLWGSNTYGQLGDNTTTDRSSPIQTIAYGNDWKELSLGLRHGMALKTDNTLWMWGQNSYGQLGDNTSVDKSSPVQTITYGSNWNLISSGGNNSAAIKTDGFGVGDLILMEY
jgi:alpha-tubulin suppressor-like RCC1 family protein